jgi:hypothetical protein
MTLRHDRRETPLSTSRIWQPNFYLSHVLDPLCTMSDSEPNGDSSVFEFETRSQLDMLVFLVALIGAGVTLGPLVEFLVGLMCAGIAVITLGRLYRREFR